MQEEGVLAIICEVAIGFAGFTGVVAIFGGGTREWRAEDRIRFRSLWLASLSAILLALLPFVLFYFGVPEKAMWRVSSLVFAAFLIFVFVFEFGQAKNLIAGLSGMELSIAATISMTGLIIVGLLIWNASIETPTIAPYLAGLVQHLLVCSVMFGLILSSRVSVKGSATQ
jgi:hypothetical protein